MNIECVTFVLLLLKIQKSKSNESDKVRYKIKP